MLSPSGATVSRTPPFCPSSTGSADATAYTEIEPIKARTVIKAANAYPPPLHSSNSHEQKPLIITRHYAASLYTIQHRISICSYDIHILPRKQAWKRCHQCKGTVRHWQMRNLLKGIGEQGWIGSDTARRRRCIRINAFNHTAIPDKTDSAKREPVNEEENKDGDAWLCSADA